MRGEERLALPHHRAQIKVPRKFLVEPLDYPLGDQPLGPHIPGRGNKHPQGSSLGFGHRLGPFAPANRSVTICGRGELSTLNRVGVMPRR